MLNIKRDISKIIILPLVYDNRGRVSIIKYIAYEGMYLDIKI